MTVPGRKQGFNPRLVVIEESIHMQPRVASHLSKTPSIGTDVLADSSLKHFQLTLPFLKSAVHYLGRFSEDFKK